MIMVGDGKMADQLQEDMTVELESANNALIEISHRIRGEHYEAIQKVLGRMEWILNEQV